MARIVITGVEIEGGEEALTQILSEAMSDSNKFRPFDILIDSDHASYVEYGTGPATSGSHEAKEFGQSAKDKIERWAMTKPSFAGLTPRQRRDLAYATYNKVMKEGITPAPFIRPALDDFFTTENLTEFFKDETGTMERLADHLAQMMKENLLRNDSYYTGDLYDSIRIVPRDGRREQSVESEVRESEQDKYSNVEKKGGRKR